MPRPILTRLFFALCASSGILTAAPTWAADGQVLITQAKALAGNVTPGDAAGFPVTLSVPGSYVLGSNLSPGPNLDGIVAAAPDISIDLNGFKISGGPAGGTNNARIGIWDQGDRLTVKNGTIGAFLLGGIYAPDRPYLIVEDTRVINSYFGIYNPGGSFARIQNNTVATNRSTGISCGSSCHVEGNVVSANGLYGIRVFSGTILGNTIYYNASFGIFNEPTSSNNSGFGNNTIIANNGGGAQVSGFFGSLHPNICSPVAC